MHTPEPHQVFACLSAARRSLHACCRPVCGAPDKHILRFASALQCDGMCTRASERAAAINWNAATFAVAASALSAGQQLMPAVCWPVWSFVQNTRERNSRKIDQLRVWVETKQLHQLSLDMGSYKCGSQMNEAPYLSHLRDVPVVLVRWYINYSWFWFGQRQGLVCFCLLLWLECH